MQCSTVKHTTTRPKIHKKNKGKDKYRPTLTDLFSDARTADVHVVHIIVHSTLQKYSYDLPS